MITDEQLAVIAKTDEHAFAELAGRYQMMLRGLTNRRFAPGLERSDLAQFALVGLWGAVRNFDPERGRFGVLAETAVRRSLDTAVKTALREKHRILNEAWRSAPADEGDEDIDAFDLVPTFANDPLAILIAREEFETFVRVVADELTPLEHGVAVGQMDGETYLETAVRMGLRYTPFATGRVRSKPVDNALARVKFKVGRALKEAA